MTAIKIPTAFNIDLEFEAADISQRFVAWLIDLGIRIAWLILVWIIAASSFSGTTGNIFAFWAIALPLSLYFLVFEVLMRGQTPGKKDHEPEGREYAGKPAQLQPAYDPLGIPHYGISLYSLGRYPYHFYCPL